MGDHLRGTDTAGTSSAEVAPDFVVIGAAKAGTDALQQQLGAHPQVHLCPKDPRYFVAEAALAWGGPGIDRIRAGIVSDWSAYQELLLAGDVGARVRGEISTAYLYCPGTAERLRAKVPRAKLMAVLRDPVERAFSNYLHLVRECLEPLDFWEAIEEEDKRVQAGWSPFWHYVRRGLYHQQLRPWFRAFPARQILIVLYEDFVERADAVFDEVFRFLGVDPGWRPDLGRRYNTSRLPRSRFLHRMVKQSARWALPPGLLDTRAARSLSRLLDRVNLRPAPPLPPTIRARLLPRFREDTLRLQELLGRDLSRWLH